MRKFIFNFSVLSALFGAVGLAKSTQSGPRDWRLALLWVAWGINVAIAVGTVIEQNKNLELEDEW
jgi:hypothetical protein